MDMYEKRVRLRQLMNEPGCTPIMCAYDVLSAKLIESIGFPIVYTGSFITGASEYFLPDVGLVQLKDLLPLAYEIAKEVDLPIICDVDNGWYHAGNIWRTIHEFESAGVSGVQLEDGIIGKHVSTHPIGLSTEVMCDHIRAACDARKDKNFVIIARTDELWLNGDVDGAIDRVNAYLDAGADAGFITFPGSISDMKNWRSRIRGPIVTTPIKYCDSIAAETEAGANMSVYWPTTIYPAYKAVKQTLEKFMQCKDITQVNKEYAFDEDELLAFLPYQKYYDNMKKYHGADQYLPSDKKEG
jgi:2-methylisocitrate lyase-like PEP mutase family enzyme